ncbi:hypothetical protein ACFLUG_01635 [Chloroflexota bacterium]
MKHKNKARNTATLLVSLLLLFTVLVSQSGCQLQSGDSDEDGFSDFRDVKPLDVSIPDNSDITPGSRDENSSIESGVDAWFKSNKGQISTDTGDSVDVPTGRDDLAGLIQDAISVESGWQILQVDKSGRTGEFKVRISLETGITLKTTFYGDITGGNYEYRDYPMKGKDDEHYRITAVFDLLVSEGKVESWEIDGESTFAILQEEK